MKYFLLVCLICIGYYGKAQDPTLFTFGSTSVAKSEFLRGYEKNAAAKKPEYTKSDLNEYLQLFINYKLKVKASEVERYDTLPSIKKELADYRKQLANSFLTDKNISEQLIEETYQRFQQEVNVAHILIKLLPEANAGDTLTAYNKCLAIKKRVEKGEDFFAIAEKESEDPSAKSNKGNLGYFTAMQMVYPFETAAYNTPKGKISNPVRTQFGYHLVYVLDQRPANGEMLTEHILLKVPEKASSEIESKVKNKADSLYQILKKGADFEEICKKYSEDRATASTGGKLGWFSTGRMVEVFETNAFALKNNGDISMPFRSEFGYHIVKRLDKKTLGSLADSREMLKKRIEKDSRAEVSRQTYINRLKTEFGFAENNENYKQLENVINSDFVKPTWKPDSSVATLKNNLFTLQNKKYTQADFVKYIAINKGKQKAQDAKRMLASLYESYINSTIIDIENSQLETKNTEFAQQLKEYQDGILLFELMQKKIWNEASRDTVGLREFYNKNKSKYKRGESVKVVTFKCANSNTAKQVKAAVKQYQESTKNQLLAQINTPEHPKDLIVEENIYEKGQNNKIDEMLWRNGESSEIVNASGTVDFYYIVENTTGQQKTLNDSKGFIVADYQEYLEKQLIDKLKQQYPIKVDEKVLQSMVKK